MLCDLDGCLTPGKDKALDLASLLVTRKALRSIQEKIRSIFGACTGRSQVYAEAMLQVLGLDKDQEESVLPYGVSVVESGAQIYKPNRFPNNNRYVELSSNLQWEQVELLNKIKLFILENGIGALEPNKDIIVSVNPSEGMSIEDFFQSVKMQLKKVGLLNEKLIGITHSKTAVDIYPQGCSKADSVAYALSLIKQQLENEMPKNTPQILLIGVGDALNDLDWMQAGGENFIPICPGNADQRIKEVVKEKGGYVAFNNYSDGVNEGLLLLDKVLEKILLKMRKLAKQANVSIVHPDLFIRRIKQEFSRQACQESIRQQLNKEVLELKVRVD